MIYLTLPLTALCAVLAGLLTAAGPAVAQTPPCSITSGNVWSGEGSYGFGRDSAPDNTLIIGEGHYVSFPVTYKCANLPDDARPSISITTPSGHRIDNGDFRGGYSERSGFGDTDSLPSACVGTTVDDNSCQIEFFITSKDNNCRNVGGTVQEYTFRTHINNTGPGPLKLAPETTFIIEAKDDDTVAQKYLDMGYTQWKPLC